LQSIDWYLLVLARRACTRRNVESRSNINHESAVLGRNLSGLLIENFLS
jgi:hypothetical protein